MYSGTTLTKYSGRVMGAHQKIDRVARRHLAKLLGDDDPKFPSIKKILHFEGKNGPDAIKRKSPAKDEPWHYYSPFNKDDSQLLELIKEHYLLLVKELKAKNQERISFEAAWLAHAIVDGLTPAHHYPYEERLVELRGEGIETRTSYKEKLIVPGDNRREKVKNNWKVWGPAGLISSHMFFEFGVASIIKPLSFSDVVPNKERVQKALDIGIIELFKQAAREIAILDMYDRYHRRGWTVKLTYEVRHKLGPATIQTVTLAWYMALIDAGLVKKPAKHAKS